MIQRLAFLVAVAALPLLAHAAPPEAQVILIANPALKAAEFSASDLREVFTGSSSSLRGGGTVGPVLLKGGAVHEEFLNRFIGKSDTAFRAGWRSLVFSGQSSMPRTLDTEAAVVEYVAHTPGAIGYITRSTPHEGVKILAVR